MDAQAAAVGTHVTVTVTLVHGTFAGRSWPWRRAPLAWTQASNLRSALESIAAVVAPHQWSGKNSFHARIEGANSLARSLRETIERYPAAHHFVVAHSHGGTATLLALRDPSLASRVSGVVCLGTPFPHVRVKGPFAGVDTAIVSIARSRLLVSMLAVAFLSFAPMVSSAGDAFDTLAASFWWLIFALDGLGMAWVLAPWLCKLKFLQVLLRQSAEERCSRVAEFVERHALPPVSPTSILIVRAPGDEAASALVAAYFSRWLAAKLKTLAVLISLAQAGLFWYDLSNDDWFEGPRALLVAAAFASVGFFVVTAFFKLVDALHAMTVGWDLSARATHVEVTTESAPPGCSAVYQARMPTDGWSHSLYKHEEVAFAVSQWIRRRVGRDTLPDRQPADDLCPPVGTKIPDQV